MKDIVVKQEKQEVCDSDSSLPDIIKILETVKQEQSNEDDGLPANAEEIVRNLTNEQSSDSADDTDLQKLQELLKEKQKELEESEKKEKKKSRRKSRSSSSPERSSGRKKKKKDRKRKSDKDKESSKDGKRRKYNASGTESPINNNENDTNISQQNPHIKWTKEEEPEHPGKVESVPTIEELENILQSQRSSDEEPCSSNQISNTVYAEQEVGDSTSPIQFDFQATGFQDVHNTEPSFDAMQHTEVFPVPQEEELQCLPVVNSAGFCGIPMFKRIKLERTIVDPNEKEADTPEKTPEEKINKIFSTCTSLLEKLESSEPSGKFEFTPVIGKNDSSVTCNSILQKVSNVHYDFQSIGPKLNLVDWGLTAIGPANKNIAKAIGISSNVYFAKIKQKSDTPVGKQIKVENDNQEKRNEQEAENEEPTLSSFFKSSVTQTEPWVCQRCVARSRIVGHDIGVQATVYKSSIGSQTYSTADDHSNVTAGLSESQIKALYEFSYLIRDLNMNPSIEMFQARAMDIYSIIQKERKNHCSPYQCHTPNREPSHDNIEQRRTVHPNVIPQLHRDSRDPRSFYERSNLRPAPPADAPRSSQVPPVQSFHPPSHMISSTSSRDPRLDNQQFKDKPQAFRNPQPPDNFANFQPHGMPKPSHPSPNLTFPGLPGLPGSLPTSYGYPQAANRPSYGRGHRP